MKYDWPPAPIRAIISNWWADVRFDVGTWWDNNRGGVAAWAFALLVGAAVSGVVYVASRLYTNDLRRQYQECIHGDPPGRWVDVAGPFCDRGPE